jgi:hypothetical protein
VVDDPVPELPVLGAGGGHHLTDQHGRLVQTFPPELTESQAVVVDLLEIPHSVYTG